MVYNVNADLNAADPRTAFVLKDDDLKDDDLEDDESEDDDLEDDDPVWCVWEKVLYVHALVLRESNTPSDPRDFVKGIRPGEFHMFKLRTGLTQQQKTEMKSILEECVSGESWPVNALTELESRGLLNGEQKAEAIENRRNSANIPYNRPHSQTNGA